MRSWEEIKAEPREKLGPGVYTDVPFEAYSTFPGINYSTLKTLEGDRTLAHARYAKLHPTETKAKDLGHAIHIAVLEPHRFDEECIVAPIVGDRRFKENKAIWKQFEAKAGGRIILTSEEGEMLEGIQANLAAHPLCQQILTGKGINELTVLAHEETTGALIKVRQDRYTTYEGWSLVIDVKSMAGVATRHEWERVCHKYGYWIQAAMYLDTMNAAAPVAGEGFRRFWWLVVEKDPPYCVRIFEADEEPLEWGRQQYRKRLRAWTQAAESGVWPGWDQGVELAGLPGWVYATFAEGA